MSEVTREVEVSEGGFALLATGLVAMLSLTFWLGVRLGRSEAVHPGAAAAAVRPAAPPASSPASLAAAASPAKAPAAIEPAARPRSSFGPPPLWSPAPLGGVPGVSLRGERRAHALEVLATDEMERALAERLRLLASGFPAYLATVAETGQPRFRVRVGDYRDEAEARVVRDNLRRATGIAAEPVR